ncbi:MAG: GPW/gp25 family protein [Candidatus Eremiobacteraeota bacterium]|nr:GPW/gp25 family protein [Candidatus Eremiobacteraeota bacterium]
MLTVVASAAELFGADLRLLGNLERQSDRDRGSDLFVAKRAVTGSAQSDPIDLETIAGRDNLQQALLLRFMTRVGELAVLGHPDYGSRLSELIGELNDDTRRNLAKLYTLEALQAEPRVAKVLSVTATQNPADRTRVDVNVKLQAIDSPTPLNFVFGVYTGGAVGP